LTSQCSCNCFFTASSSTFS